jgi:hypothetical protein
MNNGLHPTFNTLLATAFFCIALPLHAAPADEFSLRVKPVRDGAKVTALEVREELNGGAPRDGSPLRFKAPHGVFGVKVIADHITGLAVSDALGEVPLLVSDDAKTENGDVSYRHWQVGRTTTFPVSVRYRITTQDAAESGPPYGMKAAGRGVAGSGSGFLLLPENTSSAATHMHWDLSELPEGSVGVITAGKGDVVVDGPPSEMNEQWMLAGPAAKLDWTRTPGFHSYLIGSPPFNAAETLEWADRAYGYLADSLRYLGTPEYNLLLRALDIPSFSTGTARTAGGGSLITLSNNLNKQDLASIRNTIFHEMTHQWVGGFDGGGVWFSEGLTTYFSAVLPCEAGLAPLAFCAAGVNEFAAYYYDSEARNWSLEKINATVGREDVRRVPYGRGMLYFAQLNEQLLKKSNGARNLQTALAPLFIARQQGKPIDQLAWEAMLQRELGDAAVREFRQSVLEGTTTIVPPPDAFGTCLKRVVFNGDKQCGYRWRVIGACEQGR